MSLKDKILYRFDRILLVVIVIIGCSSGMVALVSSPEVLSEPPARLSFPEPLKKVVGYDVPTKKLAVSVAIEEKEVEYTVEETQVEELLKKMFHLALCCLAAVARKRLGFQEIHTLGINKQLEIYQTVSSSKMIAISDMV